MWRVLKPKLRNLSLICWEIRSPVIFEQTYYMMNLIEEHYFSGYMLIEWEGLEAKTPARRLPGQSKCERCNCRSWNRRARPKITVEEKKSSRFHNEVNIFLNTPPPTNDIIQQNLRKCWCSSSVEISCKCCQKL